MIVWSAIHRLIALFAVLGLVLTPVATATASAAMRIVPMTLDAGSIERLPDGEHRHEMPALIGADVEGMQCCPDRKTGTPDRTERCPLMALCMASVASLLPVALLVPVPTATRASVSWPNQVTFASVYGSPLPEPPRA